MAAEGKPTVPRARPAKDTLLRAVLHKGVEHPAGAPVPADLSADERARLKRLGAIK